MTKQLVAHIDPHGRGSESYVVNLNPVAWRLRHCGGAWEYRETKPDGPSIHLFEVEELFVRSGPQEGGDDPTKPQSFSKGRK